MFLVIASRFDVAAANLAHRRYGDGLRLLTCEALSRRGWTYDPADPATGHLVVDDEMVPVSALRAVVTLLCTVHAGELPHIAPEDRDYVASEMMAFLVAWLDSLPCLVVNPPTPLCLSGPDLRGAHWLREAVRVGLPIHSVAAADQPWTPELDGEPSAQSSAPSVVSVTVVAGRAVPSPVEKPIPTSTESGVVALASAVGAGLLTASFIETNGHLEFLGAAPVVDVARPEIAKAICAALGM